MRKKVNSDQLMKAENKSKAIWETINTVWSKKETSLNEIILQVDGKLINNATHVAEHLNTFFTQVAERTIEKQKHLKNTAQTPHITQAGLPFSSFQDVDEKEVKTIINKLKAKNSSGIDEVSSKILKHCCNELALPLADLINKSLKQGIFPSLLKITKVYPKFKKGSTLEASNYRPISLVSTFSKIYEKVVLKRLLDHCTNHNLLNDLQHGFTKGKSTTTAIIQMVESLIDSLDEGNLTTGIFLDFSKAFDCLDHQLIIKKLEYLGVSGIVREWFQSYLTGRSQVVELRHRENRLIKKARSSLQPINRGVPQGSVMGPVLFILFTNDLPQQIGDACLTLMYADDTTLVFNEPQAENLEVKSYVSLSMAYQYCHNNDLAVNMSKTTQIAFGRKSHEVPRLPDAEIEDEAKFLGITLDKNLTWTPHVDNLCKKLSSSIYALKHIKNATDDITTKVAYFALFESHIRYGLVAWGGTSATNMQRVLIKQKNAVRIIAGFHRLDSCREAFMSLKVLTVVALYIQEVVLYAVRNNLTRRGELHQLNLRNTMQYNLPQHRTAQFEKKPSYSGMKIYNGLPSDLRSKTEDELKPALQQWLINRPFYSLQEYHQQIFD